MLKRTKQAICSKKGESYIYVCVLVLFISALVSVVIMYMGLMAQVQIQKRDVEMKLDNIVSKYAVEAFDSIKQGENFVGTNSSSIRSNRIAGQKVSRFSARCISYLSIKISMMLICYVSRLCNSVIRHYIREQHYF